MRSMRSIATFIIAILVTTPILPGSASEDQTATGVTIRLYDADANVTLATWSYPDFVPADEYLRFGAISEGYDDPGSGLGRLLIENLLVERPNGTFLVENFETAPTIHESSNGTTSTVLRHAAAREGLEVLADSGRECVGNYQGIDVSGGIKSLRFQFRRLTGNIGDGSFWNTYVGLLPGDDQPLKDPACPHPVANGNFEGSVGIGIFGDGDGVRRYAQGHAGDEPPDSSYTYDIRVTYAVEITFGEASGNTYPAFPPPPPPPANDDRSQATLIDELPYEVTDSTFEATTEPAEPSPCGGISETLWWRYTPNVDHVLRATTRGSDFDTVLAVYVEVTGGTLQKVACDDDSDTWYTSRITLEATANETYWFQVGGYYGSTGILQFNVSIPPPPPANDDRANATVIPALPYHEVATNEEATMEENEPSECYISNTVWWRYDDAEDGGMRISTQGSGIHARIGVFADDGNGGLVAVGCAPGEVQVRTFPDRVYWIQVSSYASEGTINLTVEFIPDRPAGDDMSDPRAIGAIPFSDTVDTSNATQEEGEPTPCYPTRNTMWWAMTPDAPSRGLVNLTGSDDVTILSAYEEDADGNLTRIGCDVHFGAGDPSRLLVDMEAGTRYLFQIGGYDADVTVIQFGLDLPPPAPVNDDRANATVIATPPFEEEVDIISASVEQDEQSPCGITERSVWYMFDAAEHGFVDARAAGYAFESAIAYYQEADDGSLELMSCDQGRYSPAGIVGEVMPGERYYVQAGGSGGEYGVLRVNVTFYATPAHDDLADAVEIPALPYETTSSNRFATLEADEPRPCARIGSTVWYRYTPTETTDVVITTDGSNFDTAVAVYLATDHNLVPMGCDDDRGEGLRSRVQFAAVEGATYVVQVGGYNGATGDIVLNVTDSDILPSLPETTDVSDVKPPANGAVLGTDPGAALEGLLA